MAFTRNSGDKNMANNEDDELDDFTISQDELFFETDKESKITNLTNQVKCQLNIFTSTQVQVSIWQL